ncbi:MAG TPA: hypothetical protein VEW93_09725 [Acidimicrobiales bacterium]|nr:hypothetical protein [Acidimicrobiales bacterium]
MSLDLMSLHLTVLGRHALRTLGARWRTACRGPREGGQATAEYALVLLGAAVVAIALVTWATRSGRIGQLFDAVFDELQGRL